MSSRQVARMKNLAPVEIERLLVRQAQKIHIGTVRETTLSVDLRNPHGNWRAIGDLTKSLLALTQTFLSEYAVGDVGMRAD